MVVVQLVVGRSMSGQTIVSVTVGGNMARPVISPSDPRSPWTVEAS
jgi:hypothetical protein